MYNYNNNHISTGELRKKGRYSVGPTVHSVKNLTCIFDLEIYLL